MNFLILLPPTDVLNERFWVEMWKHETFILIKLMKKLEI